MDPLKDGAASTVGPGLRLEDIEAKLKTAGFTPERVGRVEQSFMSVAGTLLRLEGAEMQVYLYPNRAERIRDTAQLDRDRVAPPTMMISWIMPASLVEVENAAVILLSNDEGIRARVHAALSS